MDTQTRAKKNTVTNYERAGFICIRFRFQGTLYRKSLGLPDTPENQIKANEIVSRLQLAILSGNFNPDKLDEYLFNKASLESIKTKPKPKKQYPKNSPKRRAFTQDEVLMIIEAFSTDRFTHKCSVFKDSHYTNFVKMLFYSGCRIDEITPLTHKDVDWIRGVIIINKSLGKGKNGQTASKHRVIKPPKTEAGNRLIPLNKQMRELLESIPGNGDDLLFPSHKGLYIDHHNFLRIWRKVITGLGLDYRVPRSTRKTRITHLIESGVAINQVSYIAGHSNSKITLDTYTTNRMPKELPEL